MASTICWHCHLLAQMIFDSCDQFDPFSGSAPSDCYLYPDPRFSKGNSGSEPLLSIFTCANCGYPNVGQLRRPKSPSDGLDYDDVVRWLPIEPIGKSYTDAPASIASIASEVHKCLQVGAYRAAVTLSRTTLEGIVTDQESSPSNKKLYQRIKDLADNGKLKERTAEAATAIRLCGNASTHEAGLELDQEYAQIVVDVLDSVIDDLYTNPELVSRARAYAANHKNAEAN